VHVAVDLAIEIRHPPPWDGGPMAGRTFDVTGLLVHWHAGRSLLAPELEL
jgi:hypothetical protein